MGVVGCVNVFIAVNMLLWSARLDAVPVSFGARTSSLTAAATLSSTRAEVAHAGGGAGGGGVKDGEAELPTLASPTRLSRPQHSAQPPSLSTFDQLFDLFHRSPNATKPTSPALKSLETRRGQSFAAALLDSRAPGATSYIIDVKREALAYRVDTARRNCQFAKSVVQQWLREAYRSLLASNRTAALSCLQQRVWEYQPLDNATADGKNGAAVNSSASSATPRSRRYFSTMVMSDSAAESGANLTSSTHFEAAERKLQQASDLASDLWTVLHNDPIPPVSRFHSASGPNKTNGTAEYIRFRNEIETHMNAAAQEYESILQDMDHCTQRTELIDGVSQTSLEVAKLALEEAVARSRGEASVFNTVNYNVSLARAWTAIALQQRRFLREDLQEELKRMQSDVLAGVLNQIRDLVRKRKHALAASARVVATASRQRKLDAQVDLDSWSVCSHIICSNLQDVTRSGCIYGCSGALEDGFSSRLFQVDQGAFDYTCGVYCRGIEEDALHETVRRGYANKSVLLDQPSDAKIKESAAPSQMPRSLWLGSCIDSCHRAYMVRQTDQLKGNVSARLASIGGLHCAYLRDTLTMNGTNEGKLTAPSMTCGDILTALNPANVANAAIGNGSHQT